MQYELLCRAVGVRLARVDQVDWRDIWIRIWSYHSHFGLDPHPPAPRRSDLIHLFAIASPDQIRSMISELMNEAKPAGSGYAWYWIEATKRIYHVEWDHEFSSLRAEYKRLKAFNVMPKRQRRKASNVMPIR